jgi:hypothetical protein
MGIPPAHDITISTEYFSKTAHDDIGTVEDMDIDKIPDRLVDDDCKFIFIGELTNSFQIGCYKEGIRWKFAE